MALRRTVNPVGIFVGYNDDHLDVTDSNGLSASCIQAITVNGNDCGKDTTPPVVGAPTDITVGTGAGATYCTVALYHELGLPTVTDDCTFTVSTTGIPLQNAFPVGTTTITYTASNGAGQYQYTQFST